MVWHRSNIVDPTRKGSGLVTMLESVLLTLFTKHYLSIVQWLTRAVALGHVRLRINDLSPSGNQPFHDEEQKVHTVVNGEIYEYDRLRDEMIEKLGYNFESTSDCELVLALYKYHGMSFLSHLRGEFSLCLYDSERELFLAVRDRYGIKPLFWTVVDGELFVTAEMKAFLPLGWKPEWDVEGIVDGSHQIGSRTIFKAVQSTSKNS